MKHWHPARPLVAAVLAAAVLLPTPVVADGGWEAIADAARLPMALGQALSGPTALADPRARRTRPLVALAPIAAAQDLSPTFRDLKLGQVVKAEGQPAGTRAMLAREIQIQPGLEPDKLKGRIDAISARDNSVIVLGVKLVAPPGTLILDAHGRDILFSALRKGWAVKATGQLQEDGSLQATEIKVLPALAADDAEVRGRIQALDAAGRRLTVMGLTIRVTTATQIVFE
jgi:hypothetical protein